MGRKRKLSCTDKLVRIDVRVQNLEYWITKVKNPNEAMGYFVREVSRLRAILQAIEDDEGHISSLEAENFERITQIRIDLITGDRGE